jgi:hypothetical protein
MKRARKPEKLSKKKGAEEKNKRSKKKRAEEKNKQPNNVEVVHDLSMEENIMAKLAEFDKKRAEEKSKRSNQEKRIEEIASKVEEQVAGDGMKKEKRTKKPEGIEVREMADNKVMREMADNEAGGMMKKNIVTWRLSQELLEYLRTKEVMGLLATEAPLPLWTNKVAGELFVDQRLQEEIAAEFQENREFDAHVLYQYRTKGYVEIEEEEVSDEEVDEEVSDKEDDAEADGILVGKKRARKPEKPSKKEKGAEEKSKRSNQEKRTEEKNKQPNKAEVVHGLTMEERINAELAEVEKNKKKRLLTLEVSQVHMEDYLFYEVLDYMVAKPMVTFRECNLWQIEGICDPYTDARYFASRRRSIETQANVLQQYRTNGSAVIQFEATDDEAE